MKRIICMSISIMTVFYSYSQIRGDDECVFCNLNTINVSEFASGIGTNNRATGLRSFVGGEGSSATGNYAMVFGFRASATGPSALALGYGAKAHGMYSTSIGRESIVNGDGSFAIGLSNLAQAGSSYLIVGRNAKTTYQNLKITKYGRYFRQSNRNPQLD